MPSSSPASKLSGAKGKASLSCTDLPSGRSHSANSCQSSSLISSLLAMLSILARFYPACIFGPNQTGVSKTFGNGCLSAYAGFSAHVAPSLAELYRADDQGLLTPCADRTVRGTTN